MQLFDKLTDKTFVLFAAKNYFSPTCIDLDEFFEDIKRFTYIKRLLNRYEESGILGDRLILNHLIVIFNVFGIPAGLKMLEFKMEDKYWPMLKPFLIFLKVVPNNHMVGIEMDPFVVKSLRKI